MKKIMIFCLFFVNFWLAGCAKKVEFTQTIYAFDCYININLYEGNSANLTDISNIYNDINKLTDAYHSYDGITNIYDINEHIKGGNLDIQIDDKLVEIFSLLTDTLKAKIMLGAGELTNIWKDAIKNKVLPNNDKINEIKDNISSGKYDYHLENDHLIANSSLVKFDLGCVAKGYATKLVKAYLEENNISKYMIDCGQSTIILGEKYNGKAFNVGVNGSSNFIIKDLKHASIGSASILERNFKVDNNIYHHIIDPVTAYPTTTYDTICIIGADPAILDILSTYLMIDPNEANNILNTYHLEHIYMFKDGSLVKEVSPI